ncbi:MAG: LuxR C-terminal-related transcriptional regulator [Ilumatobacteraceae bacterium]
MTYRHVPPAPLTPLIGREPELAELTGLLADERAVTLTGAGGCGKTRLAYELAVGAVTELVGGVAWVELAACAGGDDVVEAIVDVLDVNDSPGEAGVDAVVRMLTGRGPTLLVLDNAEHVIVAAADVVATVLRLVPHVRVLSTSREPLGVPSEVVWKVPSLSTPHMVGATSLAAAEVAEFDAVRLFLDRARRARRGFTITDDNAAAVAQICVRLDGLPLAIELAAARVRNTPPERIAAQLDDRFRLLAGGSRTLMERQQTLLASVTWSEGLLDKYEQLVFRRLGVFVAGFTIDAAESVVGAFADVEQYDIAEAVARLVDKSLVQFDDSRDRYSLLETIRAYAMQRLIETGEGAAARDAHAEWCAAWLAGASSDESATDANSWWANRLDIVARVDPEWPNAASALEWVAVGSPLSLRLVAGLADYWTLRQRASDATRYAMPAIQAGDRARPEWLPAVLKLMLLLANSGDPEFWTLREAALEQARERGDDAAVLRLEVVGEVAVLMFVGPRADLLERIAAVRAKAFEIEDWLTVWNAAQAPAVMVVAAGRPDEGDQLIAGLTGNRAVLIRSVAAQLRGELRLAVQLAVDAQRSQRAVLDRVLTAYSLAGAALALDDPAYLAALRLGDLALDSLPTGYLAAYTMARGVDHLLAGDLLAARAVFAEREPDLFSSWRLVCLLAQTELALGDRDAAAASALRLRHVDADVPAPLYATTAELVLAECAWSDDVNAALDLAHQALSVAVESNLWPAVIDALEAVGSMLADAGRAREGARLLGAANSAREVMQYRYRFTHRAQYVAEAHRVVTGDAGWAEGGSLTLSAVVDVAQRMRGERLRPVSGWESLTPTEMQVVEQVAAGLTNPQIAERLLMSRATVKTHLVHVYAKLGFGNRAELAAAVVRRSTR